MADKLKKVGDNPKHLTGASGTKYIIHQGLTLKAYEILEELHVQMKVGNTAGDLLKMLQQAYATQNQGKFADTSIHLYNCINIGERMVEGRHPAWMMALTLFARPEGSNVNKWDEATASDWIDYISEAGYDAAELFGLASIVIKEYAFYWQPSFHDTSTGSTGNGEGSKTVGAKS